MEWFDEDDEDDRKPKATNMMSMMMDTKPLQMPLDGTDPATGDDETDQQNESKKEKDSLPQNPEGQGKQEEDEDALDAYMKSLGDKQTNLPTSSSKVGGETSSGERLDMENEDEATAHWELSKQAASTDASIGKNGESAAQSEAAIDAKYALKELSFALRHGLSSNPGWATMDNIACYFPVLSMPAPLPPPSPPAIEISPPSFTSVGDAQLAVCGPRSLEVANVATERNTDAGPGMEFGPTEEPGQEQDPILDYEDNYFHDNFSSKGVVFGTVDDVLVAINEYQESCAAVATSAVTTQERANGERHLRKIPEMQIRHKIATVFCK
ncbi:hypothetical protein IV203_009751 [Nitzschia inconspicua]|uniref:Uncharacterized protein n=1 Tax=Nitzschia inconspicua TaxID=303405 RepID=A0A9K3KVR2_9STRA|nr:hypothetical protein IV203_009751 [Nitzschia inconspicua]